MKLLNQLFQYIKNIFQKKETIIQNVEKEQLEQSFEKVETPEDAYNKITVGDIIWAKRYNNEEEMENIPENHREGPFIVLAIEEGRLFCTQGTGIPPYEKYSDLYFYIDDIDYALRKATYFKLMKLVEIDANSFIKKVDKLKESDLNNLYRQIKVNHKTYYREYSKAIKLNTPIQVGDIICSNNQNYIIIDMVDSKFICIHLNDKINFRKISQINIDNFSDLDYSKTYIIENNENVKYVNSINDNTLKYILKMQKEHIERAKEPEAVQRGSIILKDSKYYYIYGEEGQNWLGFEINKDNKDSYEKIVLGNQIYYTNYADEKINKSEVLDNLYVCKEEEKDMIKQLRKNYKHVQKNTKIYGSPELIYFSEGDVIENINYKSRKYIVIDVHKKTYECLNINDIKNAIYNPILIKKSDCRASKNYKLNGIKWFEEYPDFDLKRIVIKEVRDAIFKAQIEYLKNKRETQSKSQSTNNQNYSIKINSVVKINEFSDETFIVTDILGDMLVCISYIESGIVNSKKYYFNKNDVIFIGNKQKRK